MAVVRVLDIEVRVCFTVILFSPVVKLIAVERGGGGIERLSFDLEIWFP